jgi:SAM-dependent methyltransferase
LTTTAIQPHNARAAATWNTGGAEYDRVSQSIADSIEHCLQRLAPRHGEQVLDVATGTGWTARRAAEHGGDVVGIDLGADLIEAARRLAEARGLRIDFRVGDAEQLPFPDASFDVVVSTCGVMFASRPEAAAAELARVCRRGGRLGITTWAPDGTVAGMFAVMRPFMPAPPSPPPASPFEWGKRERIRALLGSAFDLKFEDGTSMFRLPSGAAAWDLMSTSYGPTKTLVATLDAGRCEQLRQAFITYHDKFRNDVGMTVPREYLLTLGVRR